MEGGDFPLFSPLTTVAQKEWRFLIRGVNGRKFTIKFKEKAVEGARTAKDLDIAPKAMDKEVR